MSFFVPKSKKKKKKKNKRKKVKKIFLFAYNKFAR